MPQPNDQSIYSLVTQAGIKRDGTDLDGNFYADGQWCRFRLGRPKKIGGFREIANLSTATVATNGPTDPIRALYPVPSSPMILLYCFHGNGVTGIAMDQNGVGGSTFDRTPAGFTAGDVYSWQVGSLYDSTGTPNTQMIAHASQNLADIASAIDTPIYYGVSTDEGSVLTALGQSVSGGICILQPFLFIYGNNGLIQNSKENDPTTFAGGAANAANVSGTKIVKGLPLRGGSSAPAGLFWALDSLIRVTYVGGTQLWRYDTLTDQSSILSSNAVIEYDGVYYWPGVDRFLLYNGVVKEVQNSMNQDFFFDNLNFDYRQKVSVFKVPRWGEIWWVFPKGEATECDWAVVFNVRENTWYDTPFPRSVGYPPSQVTFPIAASSESNTDTGATGYRVFRHEFGTDAVVGETQTAIRSYFETSSIGFATGGPKGDDGESINKQTRITRVEPDFVQTGDMEMVVTGESFAQDSGPVDSDPYTFPATYPEDEQAVIDTREQRRILRLRFTSNTQGGDYMMGKVIAHIEPGDERA